MAPTHEVDDRPDRRQELLDAAWQVVDDLPLSKVFAGATAAAVSARAGVTTGSFFHHFANSSEFAEAMVRSVAEPTDEAEATNDEFLDALEHMEVTEAIRSTTQLIWDMFTGDPVLADGLRRSLLLHVHHTAELADGDDAARTVGDLLRAIASGVDRNSSAMAEEVLRRSRRTTVEPFTTHDLVLALASLFNGLAQRHALDPSVVSDHLYSELSAVLVATLTQPVGGRRHVDDVATVPTGDLSPQARTGAVRREATRRRIVAAAAHLFVDSWEDVTASEVADHAGVSTQTVLNAFGTVRSLAAASFGRHLDSIVVPTDVAPRAALRHVLEQLAVAAARDAGAARALLDERLDDRHRRPLDRPEADESVPLADLVGPLVAAAVGGAGAPASLVEVDELAGAVVDLTLRQGVALAGDAAAAADLALRLVVTPADSVPADGHR